LLREFFTEIKTVRAVLSELVIDRDFIESDEPTPSVITIGEDFGGEFLIQVLPRDERIFTGPLESTSPSELEKNLAGETIYHFLIEEAEDLGGP
jgi:hypothetical protein